MKWSYLSAQSPFAGCVLPPWRNLLQSWIWGILLPFFLARPGWGATRIYISYAALERTVSIDTLETYAREGRLEGNLALYAERVGPERLEQLRSILLTRIDLTPVAVSQFLYTTQGETLLERLGQVVQTESRQPGFYAIRSALILAASDPEGLTLINVLRRFPTDGIRINLRRSLEIAGALDQTVNQTRNVLTAIAQQAGTEATPAALVDFTQLPDLQRLGPLRWEATTLSLNDRRRDRTFLTDVYLPLSSPGLAHPVIVVSHGLGSDRRTFAYLGQHLASYGFVVAILDHPGSDAGQLRALLSGRTGEISEPIEFVDRPLDIQYLLDELEQRSQADPLFQGRLNLQQVGVVGQSFGGYTALALAGAELDFQRLQNLCRSEGESFNLSLLLQCRAVQIPRRDYNLRDRRVKAIIALNSITSAVFSPESLSQIQIPVLFMAGGADTVAPALPEQIQPFTQLTTSERFLVILRGGTHFSFTGEYNPETDAVPIPPQVIGPDPELARRYLTSLSTAFLQTFVANRVAYRPYLSASYAGFISQPPLPLDFVESFTADQLAQILQNPVQFRP